MMNVTSEQKLLSSLNLPDCLKDRILCRVPPSPDHLVSSNTGKYEHHQDKERNHHRQQQQQQQKGKKQPTYVLYLPTVVLRKRHNPGFAFACYLANYYHVPLIVLVTVLDDKHLTRTPLSPICMTSRRLAFTLEALKGGGQDSSSCCYEWETQHGAGVAIRVHGPHSRTPHYLTLAHSAIAVVNDECFVEPYRTYLRQIVKTCKSASTSCWTVDGSTTVPPKSILQQQNLMTPLLSSRTHIYNGDVSFTGAPTKAWRWEKQTNPLRKKHVFGAYNKALDAPELICKLPCSFFLKQPQQRTNLLDVVGDHINHTNDDINNNNNNDDDDDEADQLGRIIDLIPSKWKDRNVSSPGQRPWTVMELSEINDCKAWAITWEGADNTVAPCQQTNGSKTAAKRRWQYFTSDESNGLKNYAKKRNQIVIPHAVSRISCYLNLGILSIFDVIYDVWHIKSTRSGYTIGCNKFLEEVIKWREGSYVHAFASPEYHSQKVFPPWSRRYLESLNGNATTTPSTANSSSRDGYSYEQLETASTRDQTWNAMQSYLIETGELHNNARMTWGKTVVHWQSCRASPDDVLWQLCCLNDRFALDGLSPPSYGGVLWCFGWGDKAAAGNKVSTKWSYRYRTGPDGFELAKERIFSNHDRNRITGPISSSNISATIKNRTKRIDEFCDPPLTTAKKARRDNEKVFPDINTCQKPVAAAAPKSKTILSFFSPKIKTNRAEL